MVNIIHSKYFFSDLTLGLEPMRDLDDFDLMHVRVRSAESMRRILALFDLSTACKFPPL